MGYPLSISQAFPFHTLHTASDQRLEVGNILGVWLPRSTSLAQWWNTNKQESTELCLLQDQSSPHSLSEHNTELTFMHPNKPAGYRGSSVGNSRIQRVVSGQQQDTEGRQWAGKTSQLQASSSIQSYVYILSTQPKTRNSVKQASWLKWPNMCKDWLALSASVVPLHCLAVSAVFLANRAHILPPGDKAIQPADTRSASNTHSDLVQ